MFETIPYTAAQNEREPESSNPVYLYGLSYCEHCHQARAFLEESGTEFRMTFLDQLPPDVRRPVLKRLREIYGRQVVYPVLEVDGEFTFGYDREVWARVLEENPR